MNIKLNKKNKSFGGVVSYYTHESSLTKSPMNFSTYVPNKEIDSAIIWLSGLTCNEDNFITKAGAPNYLQDSSTMII